jgi:hypothetical protein
MRYGSTDTHRQQVEQMAKIFMAANENPTTRPVVQGNKLKAMLPGATNNFHTALDQLEHELVRLDALLSTVMYGTDSRTATRHIGDAPRSCSLPRAFRDS